MSVPFSSRDSSVNPSQNIGTWGEQLVQTWLNQQGWEIIAHQYRCRWGEIDLIAREAGGQVKSKSDSTVVFVEVKTRSKRNWDEDGLLAITPSKQAKLIKSAQTFLSDRPELADFPCRFDVALVRCDRLKEYNFSSLPSFPLFTLGQPVEFQGYRLTLQNYIQSAFEDDSSF
ncbi:YraN family protein [Capilliphycus salinus ALCB114379]|uniref:YraN family protein n=1 Tax=Capilliphycus salinus TaxID=2768948 RepID=UPI0039A78045